MKLIFISFLLALVAFVASPVQPVASTDDQPRVEVLTAYDVAAVAEVPAVSSVTFERHGEQCSDYRAKNYPVLSYEGPRINCAGIFGFVEDATEIPVPDEADAVKQANEKFSIIAFIKENWGYILALLLAVSEILALIPGISQNGIFQAIYSWLKSKNTIR